MIKNTMTPLDQSDCCNPKKQKAVEAKALSDRMNLSRAIEHFTSIEDKCDAAIQEQDDLLRQITRRIPEDWVSTTDKSNYMPLIAFPFSQSDVKASDLPFQEYRQVAELANKVMGKQMPMATNRFMNQAKRHEIDQIEQLEADIEHLREMMRNVETQILDYTPCTAEEVAVKLKFVTALMLDGGEIEIDFFVYLVEECADILQDALSKSALVRNL